jgi:hypothetical protein
VLCRTGCGDYPHGFVFDLLSFSLWKESLLGVNLNLNLNLHSTSAMHNCNARLHRIISINLRVKNEMVVNISVLCYGLRQSNCCTLALAGEKELVIPWVQTYFDSYIME